MEEQVKIVEYTQRRNLSEIYQKSTSVFAFVKKVDESTFVQCHQYVKCRDFLCDVVRGQLLNVAIEIYGFKYNPKKDPEIDMDNISIIIHDPNKENELFIKKAISIINYYEDLIKTSDKSTYMMVDKNTAIVVGPKQWLCSPVMTSLYTLLFRVAELNFDVINPTEVAEAYKNLLSLNENKNKDGDIRYLRKIHEKLEVFLLNYRYVLALDDNSFDKVLLNRTLQLNSFHNNAGIVTLLGESNYTVLPEREELLKAAIKGQANVANLPKSTITIQDPGITSAYTCYVPGMLHFAFVNTISNRRVLCHSPVTCREHLVGAFRSLYSEDSEVNLVTQLHYQNNKKITNLVDTSKLRLMVSVPGIKLQEDRMQYHKKELFFAKKVLNYYEKLAGIKPSVISTVLIQNANKSSYAWLFTGDPVWQSNPILLSLYPLIIRAAKKYVQHMVVDLGSEKLPTKIDDLFVVDMWRDLKKHMLNTIGGTISESILATKHKTIVKLLTGHKNIFTEAQDKAFYIKNGHDVLDAATKTSVDSMYSSSVNAVSYMNNIGINSFFSNKHVDKKLTQTIKTYMEHK